MNILAIETSCDETAAAVIMDTDGVLAVRSSVVSSQVALHAAYGGVVPNLAAREHEVNIVPVVTQALADAGIGPCDLGLVAVTDGPGLMPALAVGVAAARTLAYAWELPLLGIHHLEGHIYANAIGGDVQFPLLALIVSGGHTQLVLMRNHLQYDIVGQTHDDAVGEAFDKVARMLGLPYPGGPAIAAVAERYQNRKKNLSRRHAGPSAGASLGVSPEAERSAEDRAGRRRSGPRVTEDAATPSTYDITLPRPMIGSGDFDFSFSGIKTSVLYKIRNFRAAQGLADDAPLPADYVAAMAAAFQDAATDVLVAKTCAAADMYDAAQVIVAGGVSANMQLRERLGAALATRRPATRYSVPTMAYCLDNAAMIGAAAAIRWRHMDAAAREAAADAWRTLDPSAVRPLA